MARTDRMEYAANDYDGLRNELQYLQSEISVLKVKFNESEEKKRALENKFLKLKTESIIQSNRLLDTEKSKLLAEYNLFISKKKIKKLEDKILAKKREMPRPQSAKDVSSKNEKSTCSGGDNKNNGRAESLDQNFGVGFCKADPFSPNPEVCQGDASGPAEDNFTAPKRAIYCLDERENNMDSLGHNPWKTDILSASPEVCRRGVSQEVDGPCLNERDNKSYGDVVYQPFLDQQLSSCLRISSPEVRRQDVFAPEGDMFSMVDYSGLNGNRTYVEAECQTYGGGFPETAFLEGFGHPVLVSKFHRSTSPMYDDNFRGIACQTSRAEHSTPGLLHVCRGAASVPRNDNSTEPMNDISPAKLTDLRSHVEGVNNRRFEGEPLISGLLPEETEGYAQGMSESTYENFIAPMIDLSFREEGAAATVSSEPFGEQAGNSELRTSPTCLRPTSPEVVTLMRSFLESAMNLPLLHKESPSTNPESISRIKSEEFENLASQIEFLKNISDEKFKNVEDMKSQIENKKKMVSNVKSEIEKIRQIIKVKEDDTAAN